MKLGAARWHSWAVAVGLLLVPVVGGVALGWYGINPMMAERLTPTGYYAHELLESFPDGRLVVEIAAPAGDVPAPATVSLLESRMNETLQKNSISFVGETYTTASASFSVSDLFNLELSVRHNWPSLGTMALFYLFVPGSYASNNQVIGLSYYGSSIAVFPDVIAANAPASERSALTSTVMIHEFGHELGLVGIVGGAPNEDPAHPYHSSDPNDVMYWSVDTTNILGQILGGSFPTQFDSADLTDLATVKNTPIVTEILPWVVLGLVAAAAVGVILTGRRPRKPDQAPAPSPAGPPSETGPKAICL